MPRELVSEKADGIISNDNKRRITMGVIQRIEKPTSVFVPEAFLHLNVLKESFDVFAIRFR